MKIHNESIQAIDSVKLGSQDYFSLESQEMKGASDLKFISCMHLYGDTLYVGTRSSKLYIFDLELESNSPQLTNQRIVMPHCQTISHVTANEKFFITVPESDDETSVSIWETKTRQFDVALKGHQSQVSKVIFLTDNDYVVTSSWDNTVRVWALKNMKQQSDLLYSSTQSEYPILVVEQISPELLAFGGDDCYITIWNFQTNQIMSKVFGHAGSVTFLMMENNLLMSAGGDCKVKFWEISDKIYPKSVMKQDSQKNLEEQQMAEKTSKKQVIMREEPIIQVAQPIRIHEKQFKDDAVVQDDSYCKLRSELKMSYDASVYMAYLPKTRQKFFIDRHGNGFILERSEIMEGQNKFSYGVNVTGVVSYGDYLYISTTKGQVKRCSIVKKSFENDVE